MGGRFVQSRSPFPWNTGGGAPCPIGIIERLAVDRRAGVGPHEMPGVKLRFISCDEDEGIPLALLKGPIFWRKPELEKGWEVG